MLPLRLSSFQALGLQAEPDLEAGYVMAAVLPADDWCFRLLLAWYRSLICMTSLSCPATSRYSNWSMS